MSDQKAPAQPLKCCARLKSQPAGFRPVYIRCSRTGTIERNGKPYCKQHDPKSRAARRQVEIETAELDMERKREIWRLQSAAPELLAALKYTLSVIDQSPSFLKFGQTEELDAARNAVAKAEGGQ